MKITSPEPGKLRFELIGSDREELRPLLAGLTRAFAANVVARSDTGQLRAGMAKVTQEASISNSPVEDNQLVLAGTIFGGGAVAIAGLFVMAGYVLGNGAKRNAVVIDQPLAQDDEFWKECKDLFADEAPAAGPKLALQRDDGAEDED